MAGNLTDAAELLILDWVNGVGTPTRPTTPLKAALTTTTGSDSAAGTEVTAGSYARQTIAFSAASAGATANTALISFTNMPACTVTAVEVWDSAGTPVRLWYGALTASKALNAGDTFQFAIGAVALSLD